tara:strand:- start:289 stop:558 length:270 start_codon:yes stop_codon:yes gene_type:complete
MAKVLPKKEARGRKAAESAEKAFQEFKPIEKAPIDIQREFKTKLSIIKLRNKTKEYKKKKEKKGFVYENEPRSKKAKELIRKGKAVGYT